MTAPQTLTLDVALQQAVVHHQAGRLPEAEQLYRAILQAAPNQPDANHNLGVLAGQVGQHAAGLSYLKTALEANPAQGQYVLSYAGALLATGKAGEARKILDAALLRGFDTPTAQALRQKAETAILSEPVNREVPTSAEIDRLVALFNAGLLTGLERQACLLLERHPDSGFVWKILGVSLHRQGKDALPAMRKATELLPDDAEAHNNLGRTLQDLGQLDGAVACYRRALEIKFDFVEAHNNLGNALRDLGQPDNAADCYRQALAIKPDFADVHYNLGNALKDLDQLDNAMACYRQALTINPNFADAHYNLGVILQDLGQLNSAVASYRRALEINPDYANAHNNLGNALKDLDQLDNAMASYRRVLEINPDYADVHSNLLFAYNLLPGANSAGLSDEVRRYNERVTRRASPYASWRNAPDPTRCLRVGLVSGDLRNHPVGYFLESVLASLVSNTSGQLEFFAYPSCLLTDALTERIKACCHGWHSAVALSDERLASLIRNDGIDILIDLSGHTANNRLPMFAWKPAPIQASWLGWFATTGVTAIDCFIADPWTLPKTEERHFTETILRMPETRLCFTAPNEDIHVAPLPALTNGYITFGCFNNLHKINDAVVALWAQVMQAAPGSRLFLKTKQLSEASVRLRTVERFAAHGIAVDRLTLEGYSPRAEYLSAYQKVDIALDPFPFPGGATSAEALWMGVPLLTLTGERFLSRQGVGLLMNAGLPEWIAVDTDDYVAKAAKFACDLQRLAVLRDGLRQQVLASPLFDAPRFARHFETALRDMWRQWCGSQA